MQHLTAIEDCQLRESWITIGAFDGVHKGHQKILSSLVIGASSAKMPAVAITFYPLPAMVIRDISEPFYITTPEERTELLSKLGVDIVITIPFDHAIAKMPADRFIDFLVMHLGVRHLSIGHDFVLGNNRQGNSDRLLTLGKKHGFDVDLVSPVMIDNEVISSSRIRKHILSGQVREASRLLGRLYNVKGDVIQGDGRGHDLGFPTANIATWEKRLLPRHGVYATWTSIDGSPDLLPSVTNIGLRPTFKLISNQQQVEVHLINFTEDLYGKNLDLKFVEFIRPEKKFPSMAKLISQIKLDKQFASEILINA